MDVAENVCTPNERLYALMSLELCALELPQPTDVNVHYETISGSDEDTFKHHADAQHPHVEYI